MFMRFTVLFCVTVFFIMVCYANPEEQPCIREIFSIRIDSNQHETIYSLVHDSINDSAVVYKSLDAGEIWRSISSVGGWVGNIVINPKDSQIIYHSGGKSINGGNTWDRIQLGPTIIHPQDTAIMYAVVASHNGGIRKSIDGGYTWTDLKGNWKRCRAITLALRNPNILYAYCEGGASPGIFKSTNAGVDWNIVLPATGIWNLAVDPNNSEIVYAGTRFHGVYRSIDGGKKWNPANHGLPKGLSAYPPLDAETQDIIKSGVSTYESISRLVIDPIRSNILYVGTDSGVFKSIDRGANWLVINKGLPKSSVSTLAISPKNSNIIYAGTRSAGIFKSIDGGENWVPASEGIACGQPINIW